MIHHLIYIDVTKMYLKRLHKYHLSTEAWLSGTVLLILELNRTKIYIYCLSTTNLNTCTALLKTFGKYIAQFAIKPLSYLKIKIRNNVITKLLFFSMTFHKLIIIVL